MEEVKKNKNLMPLVIVLLVIIFILGGYIVFDKGLSNKDSNSNTSNNVVDVDDKKDKEEIDDSLMHDGDLFSNGTYVANDYNSFVTNSDPLPEDADEILKWERYIEKALDLYLRENFDGQFSQKNYSDFIKYWLIFLPDKSNNLVKTENIENVTKLSISKINAQKIIKAYFNYDNFEYNNINNSNSKDILYSDDNNYYVLIMPSGIDVSYSYKSYDKLEDDNVVLHFEEKNIINLTGNKKDVVIKKVNNFYRIVSINEVK